MLPDSLFLIWNNSVFDRGLIVFNHDYYESLAKSKSTAIWKSQHRHWHQHRHPYFNKKIVIYIG